MPFKPFKIPTSKYDDWQILQLRNFQGVNYSQTPTEIGDSESPDLLNVQVSYLGAINKRYGFQKVYPISLGVGKVNGLAWYSSGSIIIAHNTFMYKQVGSSQPTLIYSGKADDRTNFFRFQNKIYAQDGTYYLEYDGITCTNVLSNPYIPTLDINRKPNGSNFDVSEGKNLIGAGFKDSFSADGTSTLYLMSYQNLDPTLVTVVYNNVTYNENVSFTVNRITGTINFAAGTTPIGPPIMGVNNVVITAYKTIIGDAEKITKCKFNSLFGGQNDTRVFFSGNPSNMNTVFYSDVYRANYFPINNFVQIGRTDEAVTGFAIQFNTLLIFKTYSIWNMQIAFDSNSIAYFPVNPLNDTLGCVDPQSIQIIDNNPYFLSKKGIYQMSGGLVRDERNAIFASTNIDIRLRDELYPETAITVDFDKKYWFIIPNILKPENSIGYIWDYFFKTWLVWDNMRFYSLVATDERELLMGDLEEGLVYKYEKTYNDNGRPINAYWRSKFFSFGGNNVKKVVDSIFFSLKSGDSQSSAVQVSYDTDSFASGIIETISVRSYSYAFFDYAKFTYLSSVIPIEIRLKIKEKNVIYFQLQFKNDLIDQSMTIINVDFKWKVQSEIK